MAIITRKVLVPDWAKFEAQNADGWWLVTEHEPEYVEHIGKWTVNGRMKPVYIGGAYKPASDTCRRIL